MDDQNRIIANRRRTVWSLRAHRVWMPVLNSHRPTGMDRELLGKTCDELEQGMRPRSARLISYIHHTGNYRHYFLVDNQASDCNFELFQDADFAGDLTDSKIRRGVVHFLKPNVCAMSWTCKKQIAVSHSSTEAEVISLDASLRMEGLPLWTLWGVVIGVFRTDPAIAYLCVYFRWHWSGDRDDHHWPQPTHASCFLNASCLLWFPFFERIRVWCFDQGFVVHKRQPLVRWHIKHILAT